MGENMRDCAGVLTNDSGRGRKADTREELVGTMPSVYTWGIVRHGS